MTTRSTGLSLLAAGSLALALTPATASAQSQDLIDAAKAEGALVFYASMPDSTIEALVRGFREDYPEIDVQWLRLVSSTLFARFLGEVESGVSSVDLLMAGSQALFLEQPDLFQDLSDLEGIDRSLIPGGNSHYLVMYATPHLITYNTDMLSEAELREHFATWADAGNPRWRGQLALTDPLATTNNMSFFKLLADTYGDDLVGAIGANQPVWFDSGTPATQQVAAGAFAMSYPTTASHSAAVRRAGAPLGFYLPEGPAHGLESALAIVEQPNNPNAARLFATWILRADGGQRVACSIGSGPSMPDVAEDCSLPAGHRGSEDIIATEVSGNLTRLLGR